MQQYCKNNYIFATQLQMYEIIAVQRNAGMLKKIGQINKQRLILFLLLLVFVINANGQVFEGRIVDTEQNEQGVPFAKLTFPDLDVVILADSAGFWQISNVPEGDTRLMISAYGYNKQLVNVNFKPGNFVSVMVTQNHRELDKLIVSNNGLLQRENVSNISAVSLSEITAIPTVNLGQSLTNIPGVFQTGIGTGVSKPVIRGLSGSSVVTYVNGLRIENQQWGGDHGLPVTSLGIGGVEVIKGPASLLYGADAIGGVLYFVDEQYAERDSWQLFAQSQFDHSSLGTSNQAGLKWSREKLRINLYGGYDNYADYSIPGVKQVTNSRYKQSSAKLSLGYNLKKWAFNLRYNFYNGRIGLPGHTHEANPQPEDFLTTNQNRKNNVPAQNAMNHFLLAENKFFLGKNMLYVSVGHTYNGLKEYEEKFTVPAIVMNLNNTLYNAKWHWTLTDEVKVIIGSQGMYQVNANGEKVDEILIPDATTTDFGGYGLLIGNKGKWTYQLGGRWDMREISVAGDGLNTTYNGVNYSAGFARVSKKSTVRLNLASGFRAPTLSELQSDGIHHGTFRYEIGNINLNPENAVQVDLTWGLHFEDLEVLINPFYNQINNYIYIQRTDQVIDGFDVYEYTQTDFAQLYGLDFGFHYHPHSAHWLHIESSLSNVFAEDSQKMPIPGIPQTRINNQLRFDLEMDGKFRLENIHLQHMYFFEQNRLGLLETYSPAYNVVNVGLTAKWDVKNPLTIKAGVRNLLNETYIDHLSGLKNLGLPDPGLNIYLLLRIELSNRLKSKS